ncbi:RagB/SusD family nutrient uptake outer membrane protein [Changchengzhania lutea]|uniref:RagB/SusD family nutrient uptake outer membrane protein n=1 Tax=Changchengzhania lutea TaxID=2049305 RepID=UPI00115C9A7A|nr:RagB/SusD family nutrient uptake outer membrane protein [Changchengzhania lutea]
MKNIFKSLVLIFFFTTFVGCNDELNEKPIGFLTEDLLDTTPSITTLEFAVTTAYGPLKNTLNGVVPDWQWNLGVVFRGDIIVQDMAANDMNKKWNPDGDQAWMDKIGNFTFTPVNGGPTGIWIFDYEGISRSNLAIKFLTDTEFVQEAGMSDARKNQLLSEVYFLRAYYYFDLVNNFGDVPLVLAFPESIAAAIELSVRVPAAEVKLQIASDLTAAKTLATNAKYPDPADPWRVSKGAIIALQGKIALYDENWPEVLTLISELDGLGNYNLNGEYFDSFDANLEFTENEVIFAYDHRTGESPRNGNGLGAPTEWGFFAPTSDFLAAFETNDPRLLYTIDVPNQRSNKILGSTTDYRGNDDGPGNKVFIRYADVLLWKAEALLETGDLSGAIAIINQIRNRARTSSTADGSVIPPGTLPDRASSTNASEIKDWLMHERRVELGWESQRFNDLKRWGTAKAVLTGLGRNFEDKHNLYPIPQLDIDRSGGAITQNPGY